MAIRGFSIDISKQINSHQAMIFSQWIGAANVIRNQKRTEYVNLLRNNQGELINQSYSHIRTNPNLFFLKDIPVQILRNAASSIYSDVIANRVGLNEFPKPKGKNKKRNVLITKELFIVEPLGNNKTLLTFFTNATKKRQKLFSIQLPYLPEQIAKQFRISRLGNRFVLSGSYENGSSSSANLELLESFSSISKESLFSMITGIDRGVVLPACSSNGEHYAYSQEQANKLRAIAKRKAHYQRILARKKRLNNNKHKHHCESNNQRRLADKISRLDFKASCIRKNFCHTISKQIVTSSTAIISLEDLKLKNMTSKAKPKRNKNGRGFIKNNGRAKSGLNRSLLNVALGQLGTFIEYKANDFNKAVVYIPPFNTSKECHICHDINTIRPEQATIICLNGCGTFHADENAGKVIAHRAVSFIKDRKFADKAKNPKKTVIRKKKTETPSLVYELASVKKSGMTENTSKDASLVS